MIETLAALFFAHVLADFVFQTKAMVAHKRHPGVLLLHTALVLLTAQAATGQIAAAPLLGLALAHLIIDIGKTYLGNGGLRPFLLDQAAHLAVIVAVAVLWPDLWATGAWAGQTALPAAMLALGAAVFAIRAGGFAVGALVAPWAADSLPEGLPGAGMVIGQLERGIIYVLVLADEPTAIGFLFAAKSILRFDATRENRTAEYVIVGTLASFAWALGVAYATRAGLAHLPPIGIPAVTP